MRSVKSHFSNQMSKTMCTQQFHIYLNVSVFTNYFLSHNVLTLKEILFWIKTLKFFPVHIVCINLYSDSRISKFPYPACIHLPNNRTYHCSWHMLTLTYSDLDLCWPWPLLTLTYSSMQQLTLHMHTYFIDFVQFERK